MRTTLNLDEDVLLAVKERARREQSSALSAVTGAEERHLAVL